jgi:ABC-type uncharacterized transport system involved in gliding motility auxiliary subunit
MKTSRRLHDVLHAVLVLVAAVVAGALLLRHDARVDLGRGGALKLTPASVAALAALPEPLTVVSYARDSGDLRALIAAFVDRYGARKPNLTLRLESPDRDPEAMTKLGIRVDGELILSYQGRTAHVLELKEREFSRALLRLARPTAPTIGFLVGHGERRLDGSANADLGQFGSALREQGFELAAVNLAASAVVPEKIDALLVATPAVPLAAAELKAISDYAETGGTLIWLADPNTPSADEPLTALFGITVLPGTVVDAEGQGLGLGDPRFVAMTKFPEHPITRGLDLTALLPQAAALASRGGNAFAAKPVLRSGQRSWTETGKATDSVEFNADTDEIPGPHDLALALTRLSPRPDRNEQRVLLVGDGDFVSNSFLANGGNLALGLRMVNWALAEDALADLTPPQAPDRALELGQGLTVFYGIGCLIVFPLLLAATGWYLRWKRRRA